MGYKNIIKVITGVRRCGKSSLMETIADELKQNGVEEENIIYLDLDKRENRKVKSADELEELIDSKVKSDKLNYLFIDEVQNVEGFEEVINGFRSDDGLLYIDDLAAKRTYVTGVVHEIFEKDIKCRVKIKDRTAFEAVRSFVINNFGATSSIKSLTEALEKNGVKTSRATVAKYIEALVDAKILYECNRFDMKSKKSLAGEKKTA